MTTRHPTDLPIEPYAPAITDAIAAGALVLTAEPGAGKSSIVPLLAADSLARVSAEHRSVVVLEPRRLAARATAERLASLAGPIDGGSAQRVGGYVGLTMRGERRVSDRTVIEVMTEAILTTRLQLDPELAGVGVIVFDEFHERNLHSDLGLAMALDARATIRPDLRIVVMSATLDTGPVARLLDTEQVIDVPGRTFDVETLHLPRPAPRAWADAVADTARRALREVEGDVLVFVPGRREIAEVSRRLDGCGAEVTPLHGGSDGDAQRRALTRPAAGPNEGRRRRLTGDGGTGERKSERSGDGGERSEDGGERKGKRIGDGGERNGERSEGGDGGERKGERSEGGDGGGRRVIVATAVAETSVTLPGIEAVVDGGLLRRARFDPVTGLGRLETVSVTRFSADQRRGRAGRLGPGVCYRLWSIEDHRLLDQTVPPEIVDGDPLPVAYELTRWGDPAGLTTPLLDHPGEHRLAAGQKILAELGLVDDGGVTSRGRSAGRLGVHPRLAALLLTAAERDLVDVGTRVAAVLDDDRRPTSDDLAAETERRWGELSARAGRLAGRLEREHHPNSPSAQPSSLRGRAQMAEIGSLLTIAWPDRIAMARPGSSDRYLVANGREVVVGRDSRLTGAEFIVVAEADGEARRARLRRAVAIDRETVHEAVGGRIGWTDSVTWDERSDRIRAERQQRLGAIVLHREPLADPPADLIGAAVAEGLRRVGLDLLRWSDKAQAIRHRLAWLHDVDAGGWPPVDDQALLDRVDDWLDLSGCRSADDVGRLGVGKALLSLLDHSQRARFDELAPTELELPSGGRRRLDYSTGRPVLAARLQQLFGLDEHPVVGPHRTRVTIELLSPAGRPAQVTTDLPGFWRGSYADVRRDLRGRYPKHHWPDEPWREPGRQR